MAKTEHANSYISKTPGFRRGEPHITGRHISVEFIAALYIHHGLSAEEIANNQDLTPAQVHAALIYYYDHPDEIQAIWQEQETLAETGLMGHQEAEAERTQLESQLKERHPERYEKLMRLRQEDPQRAMTVPEIAAEFNLTEQAIRKAAKNQTVPAHKVGRDWVIHRADALAYWGSHRTRAGSKTAPAQFRQMSANRSAHPQKHP